MKIICFSVPRRSALWWAAIVLSYFSSPTAASDALLTKQRALFVHAEKAFLQKQYTNYKKLTNKLKDYSLYPYLVFADLKRRLDSAPTAEIEDFLERYADTPLAPRLRHSWLSWLGKHNRWQTFLQHYRTNTNSHLQCLRLQGLLSQKMDKAFDTEVNMLWLNGDSQPKACDPPFRAWHMRNGLTSKKAWQRHVLAMKANNLRLAHYLRRFMDGNDRTLATMWQRLYRSPQRIVDFQLGPAHQAQRRQIALQVLNHMARRDPFSVAQLMQHRIVLQLPQADREQLYQRLALEFAYEHRAEALVWASQAIVKPMDENFLNWRIAAALLQQRWQQALRWINQLPEALKNSERWRYWRAYLLAQSGDVEQANALYRDLAMTRSYYGFLAADQQQLEYRFEHQSLEINTHLLQAFVTQGAVIRTRELLYFDDQLNARREWHHLTHDADHQTLTAAALTAQQWVWHDVAIATIAKTAQFNDLGLRFPLAYRKTVRQEALRYGVSEAVMFATIRQESAFRSDAISSANALGLMQIIPQTGRYIAKKLKLKWHGNRSLYSPQINLRYGAFYINDRFSLVEGNLAMASAAYNAGLQKVKHWLPQTVSLDATIWIENIPYKETRNYVRNILEFVVVYEQRLGQPYTRLSERLKPIPIALN